MIPPAGTAPVNLRLLGQILDLPATSPSSTTRSTPTRLDELGADLKQRRIRAGAHGRLGEIEGIEQTLSSLRDKRAGAQRLRRITRHIDLGIPALARQLRSWRYEPGPISLNSGRADHVTLGDKRPVL